MAQNEMSAKRALPERVRSLEGLGVTALPCALGQNAHQCHDDCGSDLGHVLSFTVPDADFLRPNV